MMPGFKYVPLNDLAAMEAAITSSTCAILAEPIQAEGGVNLPGENYLQGLRHLCDEKKLLLIFDEIQVGMGRTGKSFAYEHYGMTPDMMSMAKGLAGGVPIGALLAKEEVAKSFTPGTHAATFGVTLSQRPPGWQLSGQQLRTESWRIASGHRPIL